MISLFSDSELAALPTGQVFVFDIECYRNYFLIAARDIVTDKHIIFELSPDSQIDFDKLRWFLFRHCFVGFNSRNYDMLMLGACMNGYNTEQLKKASDHIIFDNQGRSEFEDNWGSAPQLINHIDIKEVAPLRASLKLYGGRLHCKTMRDLPYPHNTALDKLQALNVKEYCCNDLEQTKLLLQELQPHINLRIGMAKLYDNFDFRSLSDAQVAEKIIAFELKRITGCWPRRSEKLFKRCQYKAPPNLRFQTPALQQALATILATDFSIAENGSPVMPAAIDKLLLTIGQSSYQLGMGGLHSQEKSVSHFADANTLLIDRDVASYYPAIILNQGLFPEHLGIAFLEAYRGLVNRRLAAKAAGNKKISEGLKIAINGIFGKLGSIWSIVYSPDLMLQVTLSGQLYLLMLIEMIELAGIPVVSGNTDGVIIKCHKDDYDSLEAIILQWEGLTGFQTEETRYKYVGSRDVNSYIAIKDLSDEKPDDHKKRLASRFLDESLGVKTKNVYCERGSAQNSVLSKNPENLVCNDALLMKLAANQDIEKTIRECKDIRRFVSIRKVNDGAQKNGSYLGKSIRWYYARKSVGAINNQKNGNKIPNSDGAKPLMTLPDELPADIDYKRYIDIANEMLFDIGYLHRPTTASLF